MRVLLIAYDFPPIPSPQSLRWAYLVRELALAGHEVHVLAPDVPGYGAGGLPEMPDSVRIHRVWPGPFMALLARQQRRQQARQARYDQARAASAASVPKDSPGTAAARGTAAAAQGGEAAGRTAPALNWKGRIREAVVAMPRRVRGLLGRLRRRLFGTGLNWKGQLAEAVKAALSWLMFPDVRAEWMPWARRVLDRVLDEVRPDAVITSHEPANSIELGLHARRRGYRWIADLGDPVLAPYTPPRWRKRAFELERALCERAHVVTVTSADAGRVLAERHGLPTSRCALVTQGFDHRFDPAAVDDAGIVFEPDTLELLYTGSFYAFRRAGALLQAVAATEGVRLSIATIVAPADVSEAAAAYPEKFRLLGFLAHRQALALQRRCDVLVNLANEDPVQIPGKLYEYLGSGTPILHVGGSADDASSRLVGDSCTGWCEPADTPLIASRLHELRDQKRRDGRLSSVGGSDVLSYSWSEQAKRVATLLAPAEPS